MRKINVELDWTAGDPEAAAALDRYLRLVSARLDAVRSDELAQVLNEIVQGEAVSEELATRLAWLLDLSAFVGFVLAVRLMTEMSDHDPLNAVVALDGVLREELHLQP